MESQSPQKPEPSRTNRIHLFTSLNREELWDSETPNKKKVGK